MDWGSNYKEFGIDVNYDGLPDLKFCCDLKMYTSTDIMVTSFIKILNEKMQVFVNADDSTHADAVPFGNEISTLNYWSASDSVLLQLYLHMPTFYDDTIIGDFGNGYVGFRLNYQELMYGWIMMSSTFSGPGLTVNDHAISDEIIDGEDEIEGKPIVVCPNPAPLFFTVKGLDRTAFYKLYDLKGKLVKTGCLIPHQSIDVNDIKKGIYLLNLKVDKRVLNFKFEVI